MPTLKFWLEAVLIISFCVRVEKMRRLVDVGVHFVARKTIVEHFSAKAGLAAAGTVSTG